MRRLLHTAVLLGAAVLGVVGCQGSGSRPPADPLFANRKPVESKAMYGPPTRSARLEPVTPSAAAATLTARASGWHEPERVVTTAR